MKQKWVCLFTGLFLDALGVAFVAKADFGISAVSSVAYTMNQLFPRFTFGTWSYIYQFLLFILMCILVRHCTIIYAASFIVGVLFGYTLDFCEILIKPFPVLFESRILYFLFGNIVLVFGIAFLLISKMPIMLQDLFTRELAEHFSISFKKIKTMFDIFCVGLSLFMALYFSGRVIGVGVGTVISALTVGRCVDWVKTRLERIFK